MKIEKKKLTCVSIVIMIIIFLGNLFASTEYNVSAIFLSGGGNLVDYLGIKKDEVTKVHYIGGAQAEKDSGKAIAGALVLGVVGLLAGMINQDRSLLAIEKNDGQIIVFGIENQFKPKADNFFNNCFADKFDPTIKFDEPNNENNVPRDRASRCGLGNRDIGMHHQWHTRRW